jgi:hypothetical protein
MSIRADISSIGKAELRRPDFGPAIARAEKLLESKKGSIDSKKSEADALAGAMYTCLALASFSGIPKEDAEILTAAFVGMNYSKLIEFGLAGKTFSARDFLGFVGSSTFEATPKAKDLVALT